MELNWFSGIDVSKDTLDVTLYNAKKPNASAYIKVGNNTKGYNALLKWFEKYEVQLNELLICMEHTGVYSLRPANYFNDKSINYSMVSPLHIKRTLGLTRGKNDKIDSFKIARFCYIYREELEPSVFPSAALLTLRDLYNERERLVKIKVMEELALKESSAYKTKQSNSRTTARIKHLKTDIDLIEKEMKELIRNNSEIYGIYKLLISVIGIGLINATLLIIYTQNFSLITDARKFASYCGVAPFENTSGTSIKGKTKVSHLANKKVKVQLTNAARTAVQNDPELAIYYKRKIKEGKSHGTVMNAIKFKLLTRVFAVVKRGTPFVKLRQAG